MERSFAREIESLWLGEGEVLTGEAILAVGKALLQSGVAYVGGYPGAPVSHLLDLLVQAREPLAARGVHVESCANEAAAAAMLGASIGYPLRGAAIWKSVVGTNVASDALSNLASAGVTGGVVIIVGEDFGEGASVIQERAHAFALKSTFWLLDPRPNLPTIARLVEAGFDLSEASSTPVMVELGIRTCHLHGRLVCRENRRPSPSLLERAPAAAFDYDRLSHPPATFRQEREKIERRLPAARRFVAERGLNERFGPSSSDCGVILQGGLYNATQRALQLAGLGNLRGDSDVPLLVLNVTHPIVPEEIEAFCRSKRSVLVVEEGHPAFLQQEIEALLWRADLATAIHGRDLLPGSGELDVLTLLDGLLGWLADLGRASDAGTRWLTHARRGHAEARSLLEGAVPERPPTFCTGCPERPVFTALELLKRDRGDVHVSGDIGCHSLGSFAPFHSGNTILGYGMSLASAAAVGRTQQRRPLSIMGDGGLWHSGLITGVDGSLFNGGDSVLVVMNNGYASATGQQRIPSSPEAATGTPSRRIETVLRALGVSWLATRRSYGVASMLATLRRAFADPEPGLKVVVAEGECQLSRQRRLSAGSSERPEGTRRVRAVYGVDEDVCTGDHACIRLSGCPSLTLKESPDPLRRTPVAHVDQDCVGCGLCGEVAQAAALCPSFYEARVVRNPGAAERALGTLRRGVIRALQGLAGDA